MISLDSTRLYLYNQEDTNDHCSSTTRSVSARRAKTQKSKIIVCDEAVWFIHSRRAGWEWVT
ncbi:hypothetical protein KSF_010250 [Reticulibacter mediterranei]|uniref:Transposase n=1 Tax=Reticulibacter mediterranei TaxID=2778369 RepID=A0A8J3N154_9CHLR|nr:hypothetical protein KSF_010250 [Reticulibacter mediterranei]